MSGIWFRRLRYSLSPQFDIYDSLGKRMQHSTAGVLEVGCGTGIGVLQYAPKCSFVDAIDTDISAIAFAEKVFPVPNVSWICDDIIEYSTHKHYEVVVAIEVMEHIVDWKLALANIEKLLFPGGKFYMTARNANADLQRWHELHERELTADELVKSLSEFFPEVLLYDWSLKQPQGRNTSITPLVAVARKAYP